MASSIYVYPLNHEIKSTQVCLEKKLRLRNTYRIWINMNKYDKDIVMKTNEKRIITNL